MVVEIVLGYIQYYLQNLIFGCLFNGDWGFVYIVE